jgi:Zn-finger nucleic acid-binding protein
MYPLQGPFRSEVDLKCPKCSVDFVSAVRHKIAVHACPSCKGMWFQRQELEELEDEAFDFGEHEKGTLVPSSTPTTLKCPECAAPLRRFQYRFYDMEMEFCENQHGYWLENDEDTRVLELMRQEEQGEERRLRVEDRWAATLRRMRSGSLLERLRERLH